MKTIPLHSLVILVGPLGSGKTMLAEKKFPKNEVISINQIKEELFGTSKRLTHRSLIWSELCHRVSLRLSLGNRVVIDAPNLTSSERTQLANIGSNYRVPVFYIVFQTYKKTTDIQFEKIQQKQIDTLEQNMSSILRGDGLAEVINAQDDFDLIYPLGSNALEVIRERGYSGVLVMGDVHGCPEALRQAILWGTVRNRFIIFLGDIVDYGPKPIECVEEVYRIVVRGQGCLIMGNHERKIDKWIDQIKHNNVRVRLTEGSQITINSIEALSQHDRKNFELKFKTLMNLSRHHLVLDKTMFVHASMTNEMWSISDDRFLEDSLESNALFGVLSVDEQGKNLRCYDWTNNVPKDHLVFVGHHIRQRTEPLEVLNQNNGKVIFMDTGSGKGGHLSSADLEFLETGLRLTSYVSH